MYSSTVAEEVALLQRSQEQKGPLVIFSTVRPLRRLSRPAALNPTLHDMPNQAVITREGNRLNSAKILGSTLPV